MVAVYRPPIPPLGCLFSFFLFYKIKTHAQTGNSSELKQRRDAPLHRDAPRHQSSSPRRGCGRASPTTSCARSPTSRRSLPRLLKRRDLAIGARAGAQRTGARGADGAATAGPHQRSLLRPSVARATGRPRERPSRRGAGAVGGSSGEACRSAAPPTAPLASRRVAQTEQRPLDRTSGRCSAHPSRAPRAR